MPPADLYDRLLLDTAWELAEALPGAEPRPDAWRPALVPGTAAAATGRAGGLDAGDWWFRTRFQAEPAAPGEEVLLGLEGIATLAEVRLNGELLLSSDSMWLAHTLDVGPSLRGENELVIVCRALEPVLAVSRKPRARWRTRVAASGNLRFVRTTFLGRAPGFAGVPEPVGPWRPVWLERRRGVAVDDLGLWTRLDGADGVLTVRARLRDLGEARSAPVSVRLRGPSGEHAAPLRPAPDGALSCVLRIPEVARWWPHTHGPPVLHGVELLAGEEPLAARRVGFRTLSAGADPRHDPAEDGLDLHVNGVRVFARGAVWTTVDPVSLASRPEALRAALEQLRDAGGNLVRLVGVGIYESSAFHDVCDELGVLVWQDMMFANLDYPIADPAFRESVVREAEQVLGGLAHRPSTAVVCGNSEVEQQVAMLGLDPALGRGELFGELLPAAVAEAGLDAVYLPSAPSGGDLPFRTDRGVANYFGVGAYRRPLEDARRAEVRFASECLAFANVGDDPPARVVHDPRWKAGVPRDVGAGWDFDDVRDHYLERLYGVAAGDLRATNPERYLELSRAVTGEVMAEVFGEWRRAASPCGGGIVLWLRDLLPGAGWGLVDAAGTPKLAYHHVRRALAPLAVWMTDEGLNGIAVHVANDSGESLEAELRVALYRGERPVGEERRTVRVLPHQAATTGVEAVLGRFADAAWAYRFGEPQHDVVVASLERDGALVSQAFRFPAGRPLTRETADELGLEAESTSEPDGARRVTVRARRLLYGVRISAPGFAPDDDGFCVEPGGERRIALRPVGAGSSPGPATVCALNLDGSLSVPVGAVVS